MSISRVLFAGTPEFAVPTLHTLLRRDDIEVIAVLTQPDRSAGRGKKIRPGPVKVLAESASIPVHQPVSLRGDTELFTGLHADLMIVVAYGLIIPSRILRWPRLGCINIHASLLPRWRGAAPIQRAIEAGDRKTGITLMQMDNGLDTGAILCQKTLAIKDTDTSQTLHDRMAITGADLLANNLDDLIHNRLDAVAQDNSEATYANKLEKSESTIDWTASAEQITNRIRAFNPWPVAETRYRGKRIRIWIATAGHAIGNGEPGEILEIDNNHLEIQAGDRNVRITKLQKQGGKPLPVSTFINGFTMRIGDRLGEES